MTDQPITARVYVRISKPRRGEVLGVERQQPPCIEFAQAQGWQVGEHVYIDNNRSAWKEGVRRDEFERMLADIRADHRAGRGTAIVTWQADRLLRTVDDALAIVNIARECGTLVANVGGTLNLTTADGRRKFYGAAVASAYESELKSERLKLKHAELKRNGHWQGGQRPFGYDIEDVIEDRRLRTQLVPNPTEAKAIRQAAQRILRGGSLSGLQRAWAEAGIRRPNGGLFTGQHLKILLCSPRLAGRRKGQDPATPPQWPTIIGQAEHEALVAKLDAKGNGGRNPVGQRGEVTPRRYLLAGLVRCDRDRDGKPCGARLRSKRSEGKRRHECEKRYGGCGGLKVVAEPLEDHVRDAVLVALEDPVSGPALRAAVIGELADLDAERDLLARRETNRARLDELADRWADGTLDDDQVERAGRRIRARLAAIEDDLATLRARDGVMVDVPEGLDALHEAWDGWDLEQRRQVIERAIVAVWVGPSTSSRFTADRVRIDWRT